MSASAALDEVMTKVPLEQATPGIKAALLDTVTIKLQFMHEGTRPHRIGNNSRLPSRSTTASILAVGQML
jgi:hypothetical protein